MDTREKVSFVWNSRFKLHNKPMPCGAETCSCNEYKWIVDEER